MYLRDRVWFLIKDVIQTIAFLKLILIYDKIK